MPFCWLNSDANAMCYSGIKILRGGVGRRNRVVDTEKIWRGELQDGGISRISDARGDVKFTHRH